MKSISPGHHFGQAQARHFPSDQRAARRRELFGATRAFFGPARSGEARVEPRDGQGRVRLVIGAPETGEPSIRMLGENGESVFRLPK
jgi:hypothetical protein